MKRRTALLLAAGAVVALFLLSRITSPPSPEQHPHGGGDDNGQLQQAGPLSPPVIEDAPRHQQVAVSPATTTAAAAAVTPSHVEVELFLMRHAQGEHNVRGIDVFDAPLTPLGRQQAADSGAALRRTVFASGTPPDLILSSPLRRTIETSLLAFPVSFLNATQRRVELVPLLMEAHDKPCDTGVEAQAFVPRGYVTAEQMRFLDTHRLDHGWYDKGPLPDTEERGVERGRRLQRALLQIFRAHVQRTRGPANRSLRVVIVFHGGIQRFWLFGGEHRRHMKHAEVFKCVQHIDLSKEASDQPLPQCGDSMKAVALPRVVTE